MKTPFTMLVLVAFVALAAGFAIPRLGSVEIPSAPVPLVTTPPVVHYMVVDTSRVPIGGPQRAAATLEALLNDLGAQGWRVQTTMSNFIILSR